MAVEVQSRTIGSGKNYSTIQGWEDAAPANLTTGGADGDGVIWQGKLYAEGGGTNGEWTISTDVTVGGSTTDATRYLELTCFAGQSFKDHANKLTNALRYNPANGVAIRGTGGMTDGVFAVGSGMHFRLTGLQLAKDDVGYVRALVHGTAGAGSTVTVRDCVVKQSQAAIALRLAAAKVVNTLIYGSPTYGVSSNGGFQELRNCTVHTTSGTDAFNSGYASASTVKNCAAFGFTNFINNTSNYSAAGSGYNATNLGAAFGSLGTNLTSLTAASQFQSLTGGSEDFRAVTSGSLDGAGVADSTYTDGLDIVGQTRPTSGPSIGAWEAVPYTPPTGPAIPVVAHLYRMLGAF